MNKVISAIIVLGFFVYNLSAQITITNAHMPGSGDTIRYSNADPTTVVDYAKAGANQTWDFSDLTPAGQGLYEYKSATSINFTYGVFFGFTSFGSKIFDTINLGTFTLSNGYDFYKNSTSNFKAVGRGITYQGLPSPSFYSDDDEIYQFPLAFGDKDSSTFKVKFDFATVFTLIQTGSRVNEAEGWGTITTPYGTFSCLKVKSTIVQRDSTIVLSTPLPGIDQTTIEYKWLSTQEKIPILEVIGPYFGGQFTPAIIRYRDNPISYVGIENVQANSTISIVPNPFYDKINIFGSDIPNDVHFSLIDLSGRRISVEAIKKFNGYQIDSSTLKEGIYILHLDAADFQQTMKLVKSSGATSVGR